MWLHKWMEVAHAIADPVRREILEMLRPGPLSAGAIAEHFDISRPAISRHLRVLRDCGLVVDSTPDADGRSRLYQLDVTPLRELNSWLAEFRLPLSQALDALETEVHRARRDRTRSTNNDQTSGRNSA
jgi:DNA-binding transcriptional ArsR family regulator